MQLIEGNNKDCLAASIAMLLSESVEYVERALYPSPREYPFPPPWDHLPLVPSMEIVVDWLVLNHNVGLVPFPYAPTCSPHKDCPAIRVWDGDADEIFERQLSYGQGLIEGMCHEVGHMTAWDGAVIFDPRGHKYSFNVAYRFNFKPTRFWLKTKYETNINNS